MTLDSIRQFCLSLGDVAEKTPFGKFARRYDSILVFYVCGHMFCYLDIDDFRSVTVKSTPDEIEQIRLTRYSVADPLNMSLRHWIQLDLHGDISDSEIYAHVARAFDIVKAKYSPKKR